MVYSCQINTFSELTVTHFSISKRCQIGNMDSKQLQINGWIHFLTEKSSTYGMESDQVGFLRHFNVEKYQKIYRSKQTWRYSK